MFKFLSKYVAIVVVAIFALLHAPFIFSDPDTKVSVMSRGAWTDEGLNTIQVRNFVNHGYLSKEECDNLIKTPYFGFILVPFYSLFGTHLWVGRLLILACVLLTLFVYLRDERTQWFGIVLAVIGLLEFHVFHFSHYSLAEMLAVSWILLGVYLLWHSKLKENGWWLAAATACFSLAYFSKVTFAYAIVIPFAVRFFQFLSDRIRLKYFVRPLWPDWGIQALVTGFFAGSFYLKWYLPSKAVFEMVQANQGQGRYDVADAWGRFLFNLEHFVMVDGITPFILLVPVALIGLFLVKFEGEKQVLFYGLASWLALELHHSLLVNPPTRYLLPLYFACLAIVAFAMAESVKSWGGKMVMIVGMVLLGGYNLSYYWESLNRRTHDIRTVQNYLSNYNLKNDTILGVWGTTLASETEARSIPIWSDFNVKENPIQEYRPRIIFSEDNEAESGEAYRLKNINLEAEADSMRQFEVWRYKVNLYWISPK